MRSLGVHFFEMLQLSGFYVELRLALDKMTCNKRTFLNCLKEHVIWKL